MTARLALHQMRQVARAVLEGLLTPAQGVDLINRTSLYRKVTP